MFNCFDCNIDTLEIGEYYMVHHDVWEKSGLGAHDGFLCIQCLENRIGRSLNSFDFPDLPINNYFPFPKSQRILSRILYEV